MLEDISIDIRHRLLGIYRLAMHLQARSCSVLGERGPIGTFGNRFDDPALTSPKKSDSSVSLLRY